MKISVAVLTFLVIFGCSETHTTNSKAMPTESFNRNTDTIVDKKAIAHELPGAAHRRRASSYFIIVGQDTSDFRPIFTESKQDGKIGLHLNSSYLRNDITHRQRMRELKKILSVAANDYNLNSLRELYVGNLTSTGDLAINVTAQYLTEFGSFSYKEDNTYDEISQFLMNSQLKDEFNECLRSYGILIEHINIEKLHFVSKDAFLQWNKVETDSIAIPNRILDCFIGISLNKY